VRQYVPSASTPQLGCASDTDDAPIRAETNMKRIDEHQPLFDLTPPRATECLEGAGSERIQCLAIGEAVVALPRLHGLRVRPDQRQRLAIAPLRTQRLDALRDDDGLSTTPSAWSDHGVRASDRVSISPR